ncbi:MAG TPA: response regulator [Vicinamibacterales bacterium]
MEQGLQVFVVDDDAAVLKALTRLLRSHGFQVESFAAADAFLARPAFDGPACLILDLRMPDIGGLGVQEALLGRGIEMPIIFLSGHGDVPTAARAMREGALDFLVKPVDEVALLESLARADAKARQLDQRQQAEREADARLSRLTPRELQVCELVAQGLLNKQIAFELGTVEKTVKVHRGRVMRKLEVDSVPALVRLLGKRPQPSAPHA